MSVPRAEDASPQRPPMALLPKGLRGVYLLVVEGLRPPYPARGVTRAMRLRATRRDLPRHAINARNERGPRFESGVTSAEEACSSPCSSKSSGQRAEREFRGRRLATSSFSSDESCRSWVSGFPSQVNTVRCPRQRATRLGVFASWGLGPPVKPTRGGLPLLREAVLESRSRPSSLKRSGGHAD
jgi:hypothetical protein